MAERRELPGYDWGIYAAPWWDPCEGVYGPVSLSGYERELAKHAFSLAGGGLWDFSVPCPPGADPKGRDTVQSPACHHDPTLLRAYAVEGSLSRRQMDLVLLVCEQGLSIREACARLGVERCSARKDLRRAMAKARAWRAASGGDAGR